MKFKDKEIEVENLETFDFSKGKITFFSAGGKISEKYAPTAAKHSIVIDNSSHFRMDPDVPLIVPQVNSKDLNKYIELYQDFLHPNPNINSQAFLELLNIFSASYFKSTGSAIPFNMSLQFVLSAICCLISTSSKPD